MTGILIYLLLGLVFGLVIENVWYRIEDEEPLTMGYRLIAVLFWPIVLFVAVWNNLVYDDNNDDIVGPGGASK